VKTDACKKYMFYNSIHHITSTRLTANELQCQHWTNYANIHVAQ